MDASLPSEGPVPADTSWLSAQLRATHAGETGAVWIYRGVLAISRDPALRDFAARHLGTEQTHRAWLEAAMPPGTQSRLLPLWRVAGWLTGALPALAGPAAVYATVDAVETFVDAHYEGLIAPLEAAGQAPALTALLRQCQADEVAHRDEAAGLYRPPASRAVRAWCGLVAWGSHRAVALARRV